MLDNLSGGRVDLGLGRGITAIEHTYWGLRPEDAQGRYDETVEIVLNGLANDTLDHYGEFFEFDHIPLELAAMQRPYRPLWYASGSHEYAAREGMNFVTRPGSKLADTVSAYMDVLEPNRRRPGRLNGHVAQPWIGSTRHIVVADTDAEAERITRAAYPVYQQNFSKRGMSGPGPETRPDGSVVPVPPGGPGTTEAADITRSLRSEAVLTGSPQTIVDYVERYAAESGANYFVAAFQWGSMTHAEALHSIELFGEHVIPRFSRRAVHASPAPNGAIPGARV